MDTIKPIVITGKAAENHLNTIKNQHADMVQGIQDQSMRVAEFNANRQMQQQQANQEAKAAKTESDKQAMEGQAKILEQQNKAQELAIKQQALALP